MNDIQQQLLNLKSSLLKLRKDGLIGVYTDSNGDIEVQVRDQKSLVYNQCIPHCDPSFETKTIDGSKWTTVSRKLFGIKVFYLVKGEVDYE